MKPEKILHLKNQLGGSSTKRIILELSQTLSSKSLLDQLFIIKAQQATYDERLRAGILNASEQKIEENQITYRLLQLLNSLEGLSVKNDNQDAAFSQSIRLKMQELHKKVEKLTTSQFGVLRQLRKIRRLRIFGCAGSGKTLVAAEKAIRLANAGLDTLILCHNPYLANFIKDLVKGSNVSVYSFRNWINFLNGQAPTPNQNWSNAQEPTTSEINSALESLEQKEIRYEAIVVDEGQDFRQDWWVILELALKDPINSIFYIFHDDNQALLPYRAKYPSELPAFDLSKNCRNGGKIYKLMRNSFHHKAPPSEEVINNEGEVKVFEYHDENFNSSLINAIKWISNLSEPEKMVILLAGNISTTRWNINKLKMELPIGAGWKKEVRVKFIKSIGKNKNVKLLRGKDWIEQKLNSLSESDVPSITDIEIVNEVANSFEVEISNKKSPISITERDRRIYWKSNNGQLKLEYKRRDLGLWTSEVIRFFQRKDWASGIYQIKEVDFRKEHGFSEKAFPVLDTASFKGLEADGVILICKGKNDKIMQELYVGVSRARAALAVVVDKYNSNIFSKAI